jgi:hypothetical protein
METRPIQAEYDYLTEDGRELKKDIVDRIMLMGFYGDGEGTTEKRRLLKRTNSELTGVYDKYTKIVEIVNKIKFGDNHISDREKIKEDLALRLKEMNRFEIGTMWIAVAEADDVDFLSSVDGQMKIKYWNGEEQSSILTI